MTRRRKGNPGTLAVHGGDDEPRKPGQPVASPIVQAASFIQAVGTAEGLKYPRYGNAPDADVVQRRIAALEGAEASLVTASGQGATAIALLALLRPGDHILASSWIYGGTRQLLEQEFAALGIECTLVNPEETRAWRRAVRKDTRVIFAESPVNPTCRVLDVASLSRTAHQSGLALVIDATFASPINLRPLEHRAHVWIHSATKYLNGHHDLLGGVISGSSAYMEEVRRKMILWGQAPDPFACWLLERGMKTLEVRVLRQNDNAQRIAEWARKRKDIRAVHYPGLSNHPDHDVAKKMLDGYGGMLALELAGGGRAVDKFVRPLKVFHHAPSLGGVDSLVSEPRYTSHSEMTGPQRTAIGIPDGFVRLSVGIEDAKDLIADLEQGLANL